MNKKHLMVIMLLLPLVTRALVIGPGESYQLDYQAGPPGETIQVSGGELEVINLPGSVNPFDHIELSTGKLAFGSNCSSSGIPLPLHIYTGQSVTLPAGCRLTGDTLAVMNGGSLFLEADTIDMRLSGIIANHPDSLDIRHSVMSNSTGNGMIQLDGGGLTLIRTDFLTGNTAITLAPTDSCRIDSCLFQGNGTSVSIVSGGDQVVINCSDFYENYSWHVSNDQPDALCLIRNSYLDGTAPVGDGFILDGSRTQHFQKEFPAQILFQRPIQPIEPHDEMIACWDPVVESTNGKPITVSGYRIYQSSVPYFTTETAEEMTFTADTSFALPIYQYEQRYFFVTALMGNSAD